MILKLASLISDRWASLGIVSQADKEVYRYGLQLTLSTVFNLIAVAVISAIAGLPGAWLPFVAAFIPLRTTAGGYHAGSHLVCGLTFASVYTLFLLGVKSFAGLFGPATLVGLALFAWAAVFALAPVPASNKPLTQEKARANRKKSLILSTAFIIPAVLWAFLGKGPVWPAAMFYCGEISAAAMLIAAKAARKRGETT